MIDTIICGDCLEVMPTLEDKSVDMVLADLPYGVTASKWDIPIPLDILTIQLNRVIKDECVIVVTATQPFATNLINANRSRFKYDWVWVKSQGSTFIHAKNRPINKHEYVLVFSNGAMNHSSISHNRMHYNPQGLIACSDPKKTTGKFGKTYGSRPSHVDAYVREFKNYPTTVLEYQNPKHKHASQKPVALFEYLIRTYTNEGDTVLDPTCGAGTTAVACKRNNRHYICIEKEPEYCAIAEKRLKEML